VTPMGMPLKLWGADAIQKQELVVDEELGYSELALHEMERSHPAREWLEKIKNHTKQLASLIRKLAALSSRTKRVTNDEC